MALTAEITAEEINKAISNLKANRSLGTDGYTSEWYKALTQGIINSIAEEYISLGVEGGRNS